jgi:N-acetylmuramoyl-L-alanine amidase
MLHPTKVLTPSHDTRRDGIKPSLIILHYTDTDTAQDAIDRYLDQSPSDGFGRISPHYLIGQDGELYQLVEEQNRAWHAGAAWWRGMEDLNSRSFGIEMAGHGDVFPKAQLETLVVLVSDLQGRWDIPAINVLGHSDVAPGRKVDPGPNFPWQETGLGVWPDEKDTGDDIDMLLTRIGYTAPVPLADKVAAFQAHYAPHEQMGVATAKTLRLAAGLLEHC